MTLTTAGETVAVPLGSRAYDIRVGAGLLARAGAEIAPLLRRPRVAIVTESRVAALHLPSLTASLGAAGIDAAALELAPGEGTKGWQGLERCVEWLIAREVARDDMVIAFGGGVIGDLAGFAAAILRRGVGFVQIPTTLLAQVDSSVGGKTGINSPLGKNLVGAFHQPRLVLADTALLDSLPERDLLAGYAEVAKYGLLGDAAFFAWLEQNGPRLAAGDAEARLHAVRRSCEMKAEIVVRDDGQGIAPDFLPHVFERFRQAQQATTRSYGGTGLGLAISRQLAEAMGGFVGFSSDPGTGSTFWCDLPIPSTSVPSSGGPGAPPGTRLILATQQATASRLILRQCRHWGLEVSTADSATAIQVIAESAAGLKPRTALPSSSAYLERSTLAMIITSSPRSRSGGIQRLTTLRR